MAIDEPVCKEGMERQMERMTLWTPLGKEGEAWRNYRGCKMGSW